MKSILVTGILLSSICALAEQRVQVKVSGSGSSSSSLMGYSYSGDEDSIWSTDVLFSGTRSKVDGGGVDDEVTRDLQWTNSWELPYAWFIDLGVGGSNTKVNAIRTNNFDLTFGRANEHFYHFNWDITVGANSIRQQEGLNSGSARLSLNQRKFGWQMGIEPTDWLSLSVFSSRYSYDQDVDQALSLLQSQEAVSAYGTAFADEMSTLPESEFGIGIGIRASERAKLNFTFAQSQDAPQPKVKGGRFSGQFSFQFNQHWDGSISAGSSSYEATSTTPATKYGYVGVGAGFSW